MSDCIRNRSKISLWATPSLYSSPLPSPISLSISASSFGTSCKVNPLSQPCGPSGSHDNLQFTGGAIAASTSRSLPFCHFYPYFSSLLDLSFAFSERFFSWTHSYVFFFMFFFFISFFYSFSSTILFPSFFTFFSISH